MPIPLTDVQKALLARPEQVRALARWVIASQRNTYARQLCNKLLVPQGSTPSDKQVTKISDYLKASTSDMGIVVRLINTYVHDHSQHS